MNRTRQAATAILPKSERRGPLVPQAIRLYRVGALFRGLVDLALVGALALTFTADWQPVRQGILGLVQQVNPAAARMFGGGWADRTGPGQKSREDLISETPRLDPLALEQAGPTLKPLLQEVDNLLAVHKADQASSILATLNPNDPSVSYAKSVALLHSLTMEDFPEALKLLKIATDKAFAPAFTLTGALHLSLVSLSKTIGLPKEFLVLLDGAGNVVPASPSELEQSALAHWRRGGTGDPIAKRNLGMAAAWHRD